MSTIWSTMPMVTCPHCEKEFQLDDYYDYKTGDYFDCYKCDKEIYIHQMEVVMECNLGTEPDSN